MNNLRCIICLPGTVHDPSRGAQGGARALIGVESYEVYAEEVARGLHEKKGKKGAVISESEEDSGMGGVGEVVGGWGEAGEVVLN